MQKGLWQRRHPFQRSNEVRKIIGERFLEHKGQREGDKAWVKASWGLGFGMGIGSDRHGEGDKDMQGEGR